MLAGGLITKCRISLISTLKQTLFARSYILWHRVLFWDWGGGGLVVEELRVKGCLLSPNPTTLSHIFSLTPLSPITSSSGVGGQTAEHAPFALLCWHIWAAAGGAVITDSLLSPQLNSKVVLLVNMGPGEPWWPFHSHNLYYSPSLPLGLPSSRNVCIFGIDVALLASISRLKVSEVFPKMLKGEVY